MPSPRLDVQRIAVLVALSALGGLIVGTLTAAAVAPIGVVVGWLFGGVVGLVVSPVPAALLYRKPLARGWLLMVVPAAVVGVAAGSSENPGVAMLSIVTFLAMAGAGFFLLPDTQLGVLPGVCWSCRYDVRELRRCPECGALQSRRPRPLPQGARLGIAGAIIVVGFLAPLLMGLAAAWERHRPRSTAEWVELLGNNDMQIQWEARHALETGPIDPVISAMKHRNATVRENAAWVLEVRGDAAAREALMMAMGDPDPRVRDRAAEAIKAIDLR